MLILKKPWPLFKNSLNTTSLPKPSKLRTNSDTQSIGIMSSLVPCKIIQGGKLLRHSLAGSIKKSLKNWSVFLPLGEIFIAGLYKIKASGLIVFWLSKIFLFAIDAAIWAPADAPPKISLFLSTPNCLDFLINQL